MGRRERGLAPNDAQVGQRDAGHGGDIAQVEVARYLPQVVQRGEAIFREAPGILEGQLDGEVPRDAGAPAKPGGQLGQDLTHAAALDERIGGIAAACRICKMEGGYRGGGEGRACRSVEKRVRVGITI